MWADVRRADAGAVIFVEVVGGVAVIEVVCCDDTDEIISGVRGW